MTTKKALAQIDKILLDGEFFHYGFVFTRFGVGGLEAQAAANEPFIAVLTFDEEDFQTLFPAVAVIAKTGGLNVAVVGSDTRPAHCQFGRSFTDAKVLACFCID